MVWDDPADWYEGRYGGHLSGDAWGYWQIAEAELDVLGDVAGKDVLELGCGAARFSIALSRRGARCVGLDNSERQLEHARRNGADFPLVHAAAEEVPLPDASFDVVFSDHGAFSRGEPSRVVPEAARLLRGGGLPATAGAGPHRRLPLVVEDLLEPQPPTEAVTTYGADPDWAAQWPAEEIWRARLRHRSS